ncbi:MAG: hypothetical protein MI924_09550 [Chloroflexales bacterium]|nr:hypothetical protein [Chloroflexales bacterium]
MSVELSSSPACQTQKPTLINGEVQCALTGKPINPHEAYWAPPLVTARQLIGTMATTLLQNPGNLGHILFDEQPNVPYAPEVREELGARRTAEQLKLLVLLLFIAAVILAPIVLLAI